MSADAAQITPATTRIGWIGTGVMGRHMCAHLIAAGYTLTVFNRTPSKAHPLLSMGANLAASPAALAAQSDVLFSIVSYPSDVRSVHLHPSTGTLSSLPPGATLIDMSTSDPSLALEIASIASTKQCFALDAPVSGGETGAKAGALSIFAGGDAAAVKRVEPLLGLLGRVRYMGGAGKGQFGKLGNQITIGSAMVGLVEGIVYAHKAGLDLEEYLDAISSGAAGSRSLDLYGRKMVRREFEGGAFVDYFVKDFGICLRECEKMGIALPGLALAQQFYLSLKAHGEGRLGTQALLLALERLNNIRVETLSSSSSSRLQ
ncbi:hypothetical protein Sjap_019551 [Stephania japonica]|uniref:3-hydroxyisobutyrate dehydrogenase-like 1, mitochondrial n=1 Tax=Stephania japonica TaxID=461633 RepID=A0AAP0HY90_9MAGN